MLSSYIFSPPGTVTSKITIALLILNALIWPSVAYLASMMSKDMLSTEKKNMVLDSFWAGIWIAVMQASPIPSLFIISVSNS
ncbi:MASE2 domain-containing protein [Klebsiella pneumoniae]